MLLSSCTPARRPAPPTGKQPTRHTTPPSWDRPNMIQKMRVQCQVKGSHAEKRIAHTKETTFLYITAPYCIVYKFNNEDKVKSKCEK